MIRSLFCFACISAGVASAFQFGGGFSDAESVTKDLRAVHPHGSDTPRYTELSGVSAADTGVAGAAVVPSSAGMAIRGFVRGQKVLFSDEEIRFGTIVFLLRGCDTSQRMISPLELETNKALLPGEKVAQVIFDNRGVIEEKMQAAAAAAGMERGATKNVSEKGGVLLAQQDLKTYLRILQYATAAGITRCMRAEVLNYIAQMYDELQVSYPALLAGIEAAQETIRSLEPSKEAFEKFVRPPFEAFRATLKEMQAAGKAIAANAPPSIPVIPPSKEPRPEKGTLPTPYLDITSLDINDVPEAERAQFENIKKQWNALVQRV